MFPDLTRDDVFRIETKRLWLRWPRIQDAAAIERLAGVKAVAEMTGTVPHPYPKGEAERFVFAARKGNATGASLQLAIAPRFKPDQCLGIIGVRLKDPPVAPAPISATGWANRIGARATPPRRRRR